MLKSAILRACGTTPVKNFDLVDSMKNPHEKYKYDPETGVFTWIESPRYGIKSGDIAGYVSGRGYWYLKIDGAPVLAHRVAWFMHYGEWPKKFIDHANGDKVDNRISNLRELTNSENLHCQHALKSNNKSGITGVRKSENGRKFIAEIQVNGRSIGLGRFESKCAAEEAYLNAKEKHFPHLFLDGLGD